MNSIQHTSSRQEISLVASGPALLALFIELAVSSLANNAAALLMYVCSLG